MPARCPDAGRPAAKPRRLERAALALLLPVGVFTSDLAVARFTTDPVTEAISGERYRYEARAAGRGRVDIVAVGELPGWLALEPTGNGRAELSGIAPAAGTTSTVTLRALDNNCRIFWLLCDTQTFGISVRAHSDDDDDDDDGGGGGGGGGDDRPVATADLAVEAIAIDPAPALSNEDVAWRVTVVNTGPASSLDQELWLTFYGNTLNLQNFTCSETGVDRRMQCLLPPLGRNERTVIEFAGAAPGAGDVLLHADVTTETARPVSDPDRENNARFATLNVGERLSAEPAQRVPVAAVAEVAATDFDGDGLTDLVVAGPGGIALHRGTDAPTGLNGALAQPSDRRRGLTAAAWTVTRPANAIAVADFDLDLDADVAVAGPAGAASAVFLNTGAGAPQSLAALGAAADDDRAIAAADIDGDGYSDIVIAGTGGARLYRNRNGTEFAAPSTITAISGVITDLVLADTSGDGLPELVVARDDGPALLIANNGGTFASAATIIDEHPATSIAAGDLDGDTRADLVLGRSYRSSVPANAVLRNGGLAGFELAAELGASPSTAVAIADIDFDGTADIVSVNATGAHQVYRGDGIGGFTMNGILLVSPGAAALAVAPVGLAGRTDVTLAGTTTLDVFFNDGRGALGLGDTEPPTISLRDASEIAVNVGAAFVDPGATALDDVDGAVTPTVEGTVDASVVGTYSLTYRATDHAGNAATPVVRTVRVGPSPAEGSGGGALDPLLLLLAGLLVRVFSTRRFRSCDA